MYRNDRIITVLRDAFFSGGSRSYAYRFQSGFKSVEGPDGMKAREMPEAMLALVATGVGAVFTLAHHTNLCFSCMLRFMSGAQVSMCLWISLAICSRMYTRVMS
jgi:hypothetical protein